MHFVLTIKQSPANARYMVKRKKSWKRGLKNLRIYQKTSTIPGKHVQYFSFLRAAEEVIIRLTLGQMHLGGGRGQLCTRDMNTSSSGGCWDFFSVQCSLKSWQPVGLPCCHPGCPWSCMTVLCCGSSCCPFVWATLLAIYLFWSANPLSQW